MKNLFIILSVILLPACQNAEELQLPDKQEAPLSQITQTEKRNQIDGDFDGDGNIEKVTLVLQCKLPADSVMLIERQFYMLKCSNNDIKQIDSIEGQSTLINEGDLNETPGDEISIFHLPGGGNTYMLNTYTYRKNKWQEIIEPFLIPMGDQLHDTDLQKRIFKEKGFIYINDANLNSPDFNTVRKKVNLR